MARALIEDRLTDAVSVGMLLGIAAVLVRVLLGGVR